MANISQTIIIPQTEFTFHFYTIQSFSRSTKGSRFHFQKRVHSETLSLDAFLNLLTGDKAFLYARTVIFVQGPQLGRINPKGAMADLGYFLHAMYHMVPKKLLPESIDQRERDAKTVDFPRAIGSLRALSKLQANPNFVKNRKLLAFASNFFGYLLTFGIGLERNFEIASRFYDDAIRLDYVEAHAFKALMTLEQSGYISNQELYGSHKKIEDIKKKLGQNVDHAKWLFDRTSNAIKGLITASDQGSVIADLELANHSNASLATVHLQNALDAYAVVVQKGYTSLEPKYAYLRCNASSAKNKTALRKEINKLIKILERAERAGIPEAYLYWGHLYRDGSGVTQNIQKALDYYYKAAENNFINAYTNIIQIKTELGTAADLKEAIRAFGKLMRVNQKALQIPVETITKVHFQKALANTLMHSLAIFTDEDYTTAIQGLHKAMLKYNIQPGVKIPETLTEAKTKFRIQDYLWNKLTPQAQMPISRLFDKMGPEKRAELMDFLVPRLYEFTQDYTSFEDAEKKAKIPDDFIGFIKNKRPDYGSIEKQKPVLFALSRLSPPEFLALSLILQNPDFHINYIESIPFYTWDDNMTVRDIHQNLILFYLRSGLASEEECEVFLNGRPKDFVILLRNACVDISKLMVRAAQSNNQIRQNNILHELIWLALNRSYLNRHFRSMENDRELMTGDYQDILRTFYTTSTQNYIRNIQKLEERCRVELLALPTSQAVNILEGICSLRLDVTPFKEVFTTVIGPKVGVKYDRTVEARMNQVQKIMEGLLREFNHEKLKAEIKEKAVKDREAALAQQQKLEQVRASLWQKIQDETSADIQASSEYLESAKDLSLAIRIEAEEVLALMIELNVTIQATKAYSNDLKQKLTELKKRLYTLIKVEKGAVVNDNAVSTSILPQTQVNFKKEILESHAALEEINKARQEKVKVITTEKAKKQRQYQEAQETAAKIESAQRSDSSSSDNDQETALSTQKSIASFKEKRAKQIFHSQDDEFAGNAVRLLNILNNAETFKDIVNEVTQGDDLHDLKAEDHKQYGTCYALRVNDQYRITFYWHENKTHQVWFGDYHTK